MTMTNFTNGDKLLREAKQIEREVEAAYRESAWNLTIRRSQEVVELSTKALLKMMCFDYPKVHDVSKILGKVLKGRGIEVSDEQLTKITDISSELANKRAPSFYYERDYRQEEAEKARQDAAIVLKFAQEMAEKLKKVK